MGKFLNGKLKEAESVKEITDQDRIDRLEAEAQDLGETGSLKPLANVKDIE